MDDTENSPNFHIFSPTLTNKGSRKNEETKRFEDHKQTINTIKLILPLPFIFSKNLRIIEKEFSLQKEEEEIEVNDFKTKRNNYPIVRHVATTNAQTLMNTIACV